MPRYLQLLSLILLLIPAANSHAQETLTAEQEKNFSPHYLFSNYFGSGLYSTSEQSIMIFNMPFTYEPEQKGPNKYRIRLPLSLGLYNFSFDNIDDVRVNDAATVTFTVGIEFDHWATPNLKLVPFIDLGISENFTDNDRAAIYASGLSSYYYFEAWEEKQLWLTRFQRAGYRTMVTDVSDGFSSLETGVDLTLPWRFEIANQAMFVSTYAMAYWYMIDLALDPSSLDPRKETNAQEIGITLGFAKVVDLKIFNLERLGIGYRYSHRAPNALRLFFNMPLE